MTAPKSAKPTMKPIALVDREDPVPEEREREDRLGRPPLDEREGDEQHDAEHGQADDLRRAPRPGRPAEAREEHDRGEPAGEQRRAEVVDRGAARARRGLWNATAITASASRAERAG